MGAEWGILVLGREGLEGRGGVVIFFFWLSGDFGIKFMLIFFILELEELVEWTLSVLAMFSLLR